MDPPQPLCSPPRVPYLHPEPAATAPRLLVALLRRGPAWLLTPEAESEWLTGPFFSSPTPRAASELPSRPSSAFLCPWSVVRHCAICQRCGRQPGALGVLLPRHGTDAGVRRDAPHLTRSTSLPLSLSFSQFYVHPFPLPPPRGRRLYGSFLVVCTSRPCLDLSGDPPQTAVTSGFLPWYRIDGATT